MMKSTTPLFLSANYAKLRENMVSVKYTFSQKASIT